MSSKQPPTKQAKIASFFSTSSSSLSSSSSPLPTAPSPSSPTSTQPVADTSTAVASSNITQAAQTPAGCLPMRADLPQPLDIGDFVSKRPSDQTKYQLCRNPWIPPPGYSFPATTRTIKSTGRSFTVKFQQKWLDRFHSWLAFSHIAQGAYCRICVIFGPTEAGGNRLKTLTREPLQNWKDALEICNNHKATSYHMNSMTMAEGFLKAFEGGTDVVASMDKGRREHAEANRRVLASIVDCVKLCGRQNIALRGHRDDGPLTDPTNPEPSKNDGNFRALVRFKVASGDQHLGAHMSAGPRNATYISKDVQNEIITICGGIIREEVVGRVNSAGIFSVLADETEDASNKEQFSLCVRYAMGSGSSVVVREDFLGFVEVTDLTGENLARQLVETLTAWGVNLDGLRGHGYDGARNMAGRFQGVQARILELFPQALYTHCASHCLNLVLCAASKLPEVRKFVQHLKDVANFIKESPKRNSYLIAAVDALAPEARRKKLKSICETPWVERHEAVNTFAELISPIIHALAELENIDDTTIAAKAENFRHRIRTGSFFMSLQVLQSVLSITLPLSRVLQDPACDIVACTKMVKDTQKCIKDMRDNSEQAFSAMFGKASYLAGEHGTVLDIPRTSSRHAADSAEVYYRQQLFIPFLNAIIDQIDKRFSAAFEVAAKVYCLIPSHIEQYPFSIDDLCDFYSADVDSIAVVNAEYLLWQQKWKQVPPQDRPSSAIDAFAAADPQFFPNISILLKILSSLPVTTATAERSFSTLRRLKTYLRSSTGEERLNGLALLHIHRDVPVPTEEVVETFARIKARKLDLIL